LKGEYGTSWDRLLSVDFLLKNKLPDIAKLYGTLATKTLPFAEGETLIKARFGASPEVDSAINTIKDRINK
jgi:hypothetical protein